MLPAQTPCPSYRRQEKVRIPFERPLREDRSTSLEQAENPRHLRVGVGQMLDHVSEVKNVSLMIGVQFSGVGHDQHLSASAVLIRDALTQFHAHCFPPLLCR